jgi:hypothetical protein
VSWRQPYRIANAGVTADHGVYQRGLCRLNVVDEKVQDHRQSVTLLFWPAWPERYHTTAMLALLLAKVLAQSGQVIEPREQVLATRACLLDDRVFPHWRHR